MTTIPPVIMFCGKKKSGKDFAADRFVEEYGYTKIHIAEPWIRTQLEEMGVTWGEYNRNKALYRPEIQARANGPKGRGGDKEVLLRPLQETLQAFTASKTPVVVSGLRFINECEWGIGTGHLVVKVELPEYERRKRLVEAGETLIEDPFEAEIDSCPCHLKFYGGTPSQDITKIILAGYSFLLGL